MLKELAKGYIKKTKKLQNNENLTDLVAQYKGNIRLNNKQLVVEVYGSNQELNDKQIFVKISKEIADKEIYGIL